MTECWVMNKYHPFLGLLLQLKCIASSQLVGNFSVRSPLSHTRAPRWHRGTPLPRANTEQYPRWEFFCLCFLLVPKKPWNTQINKNTKPKQQQQKPQTKTTIQTTVRITWAHFHVTYQKSRQETWCDSFPTCSSQKHLLLIKSQAFMCLS